MSYHKLAVFPTVFFSFTSCLTFSKHIVLQSTEGFLPSFHLKIMEWHKTYYFHITGSDSCIFMLAIPLINFHFRCEFKRYDKFKDSH
jgi:hypothetical protein